MPKMSFPNHDYMRFKRSYSMKYSTDVQAEINNNISVKNKNIANPVYNLMKSYSVISKLFSSLGGKQKKSKTIQTESGIQQNGRKTYSSYFIKRSKTMNNMQAYQPKNQILQKKSKNQLNLNKVNDKLNAINENLSKLQSKMRKNKIQMLNLDRQVSKSLKHFQQMHSPLSDTSLQTFQQNKKIIEVCRQEIKIGKRKPSQRISQIENYKQPNIPLKKKQIILRIQKTVNIKKRDKSHMQNLKLKI